MFNEKYYFAYGTCIVIRAHTLEIKEYVLV